MIDLNTLHIINYCSPQCSPLKNLVSLPKEEAFSLAFEMAGKNPDTTAFYRFADFENYYPLRMAADKALFHSFISLGGKPRIEHPLSFVLEGSEYLQRWFGGGTMTELLLGDIPSDIISFTFGDSCSGYQRQGNVTLVTKEVLHKEMMDFPGTLGEYMQHIEQTCHYIEAQLWDEIKS